ncbi:MAG: hypothetical protein R2726_11405 [Acidimicrobiales bacterium]
MRRLGQPAFDQLLPVLAVGGDLDQAGGDRVDVERVDQHRRTTGHLGQGGAVGRQHRRPPRHRLDRRQAEPLVHRQVGQRLRRTQQVLTLAVVDPAEPHDRLRGDVRQVESLVAAPPPGAGEHQLMVGQRARPASCDERLDQPRHVLARVEVAQVQDERPGDARGPEPLATRRLLLGVERARRIDRVGDDDDTLGVEAEVRQDLALAELADGQDHLRPRDLHPERRPQAQPRRGRVPGRVAQRRDVVDHERGRRGSPGGRVRDAEDRLGGRIEGPHRLGQHDREVPCPGPAPHAAHREPRARHHRRQLGIRGQERDEPVVLAGTGRETADEPAEHALVPAEAGPERSAIERDTHEVGRT